MKKKDFPFQVHMMIGILWIFIGAFLQQGVELLIWVAGGIIMIILGLMGKKSKKSN